MKITWLGQAGLLLETGGKKIVIDPYLSDNVRNYEPKNYRRVSVDGSFLGIRPDVIIVTHDHLDHLDTETLKYYLPDSEKSLVLAPRGAWQKLRAFGGESNYVMFNSGTSWTEGGVSFYAVRAEHSDPDAIGVIVTAEGKNYYVTGDTLYSERVFESLPDMDIEVLFLPVNGVGNNMNMKDGARFAERIGARYTVPFHIGLFDSLEADAFECQGRVIPRIYKEIIFD